MKRPRWVSRSFDDSGRRRSSPGLDLTAAATWALRLEVDPRSRRLERGRDVRGVADRHDRRRNGFGPRAELGRTETGTPRQRRDRRDQYERPCSVRTGRRYLLESGMPGARWGAMPSRRSSDARWITSAFLPVRRKRSWGLRRAQGGSDRRLDGFGVRPPWPRSQLRRGTSVSAHARVRRAVTSSR